MSRAILFLLLAGLFGCSDDPPMTTASTPDTGRIDGELPNVVLLVAERLDPLDLEDPETLASCPGLARLVSEGSRFASAFAPTSSAQHAARCLETGQRPGAGRAAPDVLESLDGYLFAEREGAECLDAIEPASRFFLRVFLPGPAAQQRGRIDTLLSALFARLQQQGLADDTLVVLTSESAPASDGSPLSDESLRVPLVFWLPGRVPANEVRQQLVSHPDVPVTLRDLLGAEPSGGVDGESFARLLTKRRQAWRDHVVFEEAADGEWRVAGRAFRTKAWKYVRAANGTESFYSMRNDPREQDDALEDPRLAQFLEQNRTRLAEWVQANAR